jgi:hypothetical protein
MSKKKTGEFEMTYEERRRWTEAQVNSGLAKHYEEQAQIYTERAARANVEFWTHLRQTRDFPKDGVITVNRDKTLIVVEDKARAEQIRAKYPKRINVAKEK